MGVTGKKFKGIDVAAREIISTLMHATETMKLGNGKERFLHRGIKYISPQLVVKGTLRGRLDKRGDRIGILITAGSPNYRERDFLKLLRAAKTKLPLRRVQLEYRAPRIRRIKGKTRKL